MSVDQAFVYVVEVMEYFFAPAVEEVEAIGRAGQADVDAVETADSLYGVDGLEGRQSLEEFVDGEVSRRP